MLVEREEPLRTLRDALARAQSGSGCTVLVSGEAGIGKTALLRDFAQHLGPAVRLHWGGSEDLFTPRPLGPLQDMAHQLEPPIAALLSDSAAPGILLPALLDTLQRRDGSSVLVFEDVHWADHATLDVIKYLGRRISQLPVVLVLTLRRDEVGADHPVTKLIGDLPAHNLLRVSLLPLSSQGVDTLAQSAGRASDGLYQLTGGNPFFVTEYLSNVGAPKNSLPDSVRDAVWARLSRLAQLDLKALESLSIVPGKIEPWLGIVPGKIEPWLAEALAGREARGSVDRCVERGLLLRDNRGNLQFRHELARQATLERVPPSLQEDLHGRVVALLETASTAGAISLSRLVHHASGAGQVKRVLRIAPMAAAEAARLGAHEQAAAHLATALRYVEYAPILQAAQLYESWAYEAGLSLRIDDEIIEARRRAVTMWGELGRLDKVGVNLRWLSRLHWYRGESVLAGQLADESIQVLESLPPGPELAMAYSVRSQFHMLFDRFDAAIEWGHRAIELADQLGEIETKVHALNSVGMALLLSSRPGGREQMELSLSLALQHGLHEQAARAYTNYGEYAVLFKDFALAERLLSEGIAFDTRHDLDAWTHYLVGRLAQLRLDQGRLREAEIIASGVVNLDRLTLVMRLPALTALGRIRVRLGESDGPTLLQRALNEALSTGEPQNIAPARLALTEAAWLAGDASAGYTQLRQLAAMPLDGFDRWELGEMAVWWNRFRVPEPFPTATEEVAEPYAAELRGETTLAATLWSELGLPFDAALARMQVEGTAAATALREAVEAMEALGAMAGATLGRRLGHQKGITDQLPKVRRGPYASARQHPLGLTKREAQVLELIAQGMGNHDIARKIFRSPRTVEHHVSAVLAKLNAANKIEVVLRARSEPWLISPTADAANKN